MNILIDAHDITLAGGIERFVTNLANAMTQRGHKVFLFTYAKKNKPPHYSLDPNINIIHYLFTGSQAHIPKIRRQILACSADIFISPAAFNNHLLWCKALEGTGIPWIYSERNDPNIIMSELWDTEERNATLFAADSIHLLLPYYKDTIPKSLQSRVHIIPHAIKAPENYQVKTYDSRILLSLGRLSAQKQINLLIDAFTLLIPDFPEWQLEIWGEGEEALHLRRQIERLGIAEKVRLCGLSKNPWVQYANADILCMPSRFEGLPNTAVEAMSMGLPVVGFNQCIALSNIIKHNHTGLLAPEMTPQSFAETLYPLMKCIHSRQTLGKNASEDAKKYNPILIFDKWEDLLQETAKHNGNTALQQCLNEIKINTIKNNYIHTLLQLLQRPNVLLNNRQYLRRFIRRYPLIKELLQPVRQKLDKFKANITYSN